MPNERSSFESRDRAHHSCNGDAGIRPRSLAGSAAGPFRRHAGGSARHCAAARHESADDRGSDYRRERGRSARTFHRRRPGSGPARAEHGRFHLPGRSADLHPRHRLHRAHRRHRQLDRFPPQRRLPVALGGCDPGILRRRAGRGLARPARHAVRPQCHWRLRQRDLQRTECAVRLRGGADGRQLQPLSRARCARRTARQRKSRGASGRTGRGS